MRGILFVIVIAVVIMIALLTSCISIKEHNKRMNAYVHDYQIELYLDTVRIYDKNRFVGMIIHTGDSSWFNPYDSIFMKDNMIQLQNLNHLHFGSFR